MANYYNKDIYKVLEVNYDADEKEIKQSYRRLVRKYHPDSAGSDANVLKFKEIQEAYEILSNEDTRKKYDILHGYYREKIKKSYKNETTKNKYEEYIKSAQKHAQSSMPFSQSVNEALDSLFHSKKTTGKKEAKMPVNGDDINLEISLSCFETINGTNRKVNILHTQPCPKCEGRKFINGTECSMCKGTGQLSLQKKINVKIPKGVNRGSKIRVKKEGNKGLNGGKDGDLYLIVKIEKNPYFDTEGMNILCNLPITPYEAVLGADVNLKIMDENIMVKIPAMTSSGQKLRLAGLGLYNKAKTKRGDIIITVEIKLPKKLSPQETELYEKLKQISDYDIREELKYVK